MNQKPPIKFAHTHRCPQCGAVHGCGDPVHRLNKANERIYELGEALFRYGGHEDHCENPKHFCTCGFGDLLGSLIGDSESHTPTAPEDTDE